MLDVHRNWFKGIENKTADIFAVLPVAPNHYTALSIVSALVALYFMADAEYFLALAFFGIAAFLDLIDGAVARRNNLGTKRGAYWDTIADRYVEAIILFGILLANLPDFYLSATAWIFILLAGSMMTTYAKAAAKEKELAQTELKGGLMSRGERLLLLFAAIALLGYFPELSIKIIALAAVLSHITAIQRIVAALKQPG